MFVLTSHTQRCFVYARQQIEPPCTMQEKHRQPCNKQEKATAPHHAGETPYVNRSREPNRRTTWTFQEDTRAPRCTMQETASRRDKVLDMGHAKALQIFPKTYRFWTLQLPPSSHSTFHGYVVQCRAGYLGGFVPWTNGLQTRTKPIKITTGTRNQEPETNALIRRYIHFNRLFPFESRYHK